MVSVALSVTAGESIPLQVGESSDLPLVLDTAYIGGQLPDYTGQTTVTPASTAQTLATAGKSVHQDITVEPIPQNYGLIEYDGTVIAVR